MAGLMVRMHRRFRAAWSSLTMLVALSLSPGGDCAEHDEVLRTPARTGTQVSEAPAVVTLGLEPPRSEMGSDEEETHSRAASALGESRLFTFSDDESAFFFTGGMAIDVDGAPNAYHPDDIGIGQLRYAGRPGKWYGLATDRDGEPYIQTPDDPYPGYYVSTTALCDGRYQKSDRRRYIDSTSIPYIVLPRNINSMIPDANLKVRLGDLAVVASLSNLEGYVHGYYADVGPSKKIDPAAAFGEGSIKLARALGHNPFVIRNGRKRAAQGISSGVLYVVFPGTGTGTPLSNQQIERLAHRVFREWGGLERLRQAAARLQPAVRNRHRGESHTRTDRCCRGLALP